MYKKPQKNGDDVLCRPPLECCYQRSTDGWREKSLLGAHKIDDDQTIKGWEI